MKVRLFAILLIVSVSAALLGGCQSEDTLSNTVKPVPAKKYENPNNGQNPMGGPGAPKTGTSGGTQ